MALLDHFFSQGLILNFYFNTLWHAFLLYHFFTFTLGVRPLRVKRYKQTFYISSNVKQAVSISYLANNLCFIVSTLA